MMRGSGQTSPLYRGFRLAQCVGVGLVLLFLMGPLLVMMPLSLSSGSMLIYPLPGVSLRWYEALFTEPRWRLALENSVVIAVCVTIASTTLGTIAALALAKSTSRWRPLLMSAILSPMIIPSVIVAVGMFFFYAQLGLTGTFAGIVIAHTAMALPFVVITVSSTLQGYDDTLTRAASGLGAGPLYAFRTVTMPLIAPGIASGALFAFSTSFDEIVIVLFLASPDQRTLPRQMFDGIQYNIDPTVAAAATMMVFTSAVLLAGVEILRRRGARTIAG
jgi:putative spermidine/putrescine transport system permease protein